VPFWWEFGNWLEMLLETFVITRGSWLWVKRRLGFGPQCQCGQRREKLNAIGAGGMPLSWPAIP
jgi:hypothetical protein